MLKNPALLTGVGDDNHTHPSSMLTPQSSHRHAGAVAQESMEHGLMEILLHLLTTLMAPAQRLAAVMAIT